MFVSAQSRLYLKTFTRAFIYVTMPSNADTKMRNKGILIYLMKTCGPAILSKPI